MYGKITENSIRISKEKIEGYKPLVDERPLNGGGAFRNMQIGEIVLLKCIQRR